MNMSNALQIKQSYLYDDIYFKFYFYHCVLCYEMNKIKSHLHIF
jgi:hypothetical protein